jgi:CRISPR-associated protein Csh1
LLRSIAKIGECVRVKEELPIKGVKEGLLAKIIFDIDNGLLDCDPYITCDEERAKEFLWIGNARGQDRQVRLTTDNPKYLLDYKKKHKWGIGCVIEYIDDANLHGDEDVEKVYRLLMEVKEKFFTANEDLVLRLEKVCREKGVDIRKITLYTMSVKAHGVLVDAAKERGYRKVLSYALSYGKTLKYPTGYGKCYVCGREGEVLSNPDYPKGTILGMYVIDKVGFLSGMSRSTESMIRTHSICIECKKNLEAGVNFVNTNLSNRIGDITVWIIPTIISEQLSLELLNHIADICQKTFERAKTRLGLTSIEEMEKELDRFLKLRGFPYAVNLVFGQPRQSQFLYHGALQDVPIMKFIEIGKVSEKLAEIMSQYLVIDWTIGLDRIYNIFPLRKIKGEVKPKPFIQLMETILTGSYYPREQIIKAALSLAKIHRFKNYAGYNIREDGRKDSDLKLSEDILLYNLLHKFLIELGVWNMEGYKGLPVLNGVSKDIVDFCREQGYSEHQVGLFLLGVLVGKIGREQYRKGDKKKAILDKIDFDGMSSEKIKWLFNIVLEGLRNYRILEFNEAIYANAKLLIDKNIEKLINPLDNTFYVLSGYAYATLKSVAGGEA